MSGIINKVKDALHSDKAHEQPEGTHGPHSSRAANAADPRIDSDRDGRANPATTSTHAGTSGLGSTSHGTSNVTGYDDPTGTHGPHGRVGNAVDPRVDSDADHRAAGHSGGLGSTGTHAGGLGSTGAHSGGIGSTGTHAGGIGSAGTHSSGLGSTGTHAGTTGLSNIDPAGTHGPHGRVGSTGTHHAGGVGSTGTHIGTPGPAPTTAGPHKADLLNKADPRVDSDLDGSKTVGGNKTYQQ